MIDNLASGRTSRYCTFIEISLTYVLGAIQPQQMITRKIKLENIVEDGIKALIRDKDNQVKVLVDINDK